MCVAGHYLRIVLREDTKTYPSRFGVWIAPMDGRESKSIPQGWRPLNQGNFILALHRTDPGEAALDFFRLFQPGPAE